MSAPALQPALGSAAERCAAFSRAWRVFAAALGYPEGEALEDVKSGALAYALAEVLGDIEPALAAGLDLAALLDGGDGDTLAVEYTRLFDVGAAGPPLPALRRCLGRNPDEDHGRGGALLQPLRPLDGG